MRFAYTGVTRQKEQVKGVIEATDVVEAKLKLRAMQVRPLAIVKTRGEAGRFDFKKLSEINIGKPIDLKGLLIFVRQFSSLIDAGVPIVQALDILGQQEKRQTFKKILVDVKGRIEAGSSLAEAMGKHKGAFNHLFVSLVEAGEISGTLEITLQRLGAQLEKTDRIVAKVKSAMVYPVITLVVSVFVLIFLLVKVIPEVSKLYDQGGAKLPEITQRVLELSFWVQANYLTIIYLFGGLVVAIIVGARVQAVRRYVDPLLLHVPLFGSLIKKSAITRFARTLSTLVASGVPLLNSFEICAKIMSNYAIRDIVISAAAYVSEGKSVAFGLSQKKIFPPMVVHMVSIGEVTGKLDELLAKVADIYEDEVDDAVGNLTGLVQPALIICVGGIIAFLLLAMYLPIFQLAEKVTGGM